MKIGFRFSRSSLAATMLINPLTDPSLTNQRKCSSDFLSHGTFNKDGMRGDMESSACTYPLHDQRPVALSVVVGGRRKRSIRGPSGLIRGAGGSVARQIADSTAGPKRRSVGQDPRREKFGENQLTVASVGRWRAVCRRFSFCRWARRVRCRNLTSPWGPAD